MAKVTVFPTKFIKGWAGTGEMSCWPTVELETMLEERFSTDAHFVPYFIEGRSEIPRINRNADVGELGELRFSVLVFDVDCKEAHSGGVMPDTWRSELLSKLESLEFVADFGCYMTKGGARLLLPLESAVDRARYMGLLAGGRKALSDGGIEADELTDWNRFYRCPHVVRDGAAQELASDFDWMEPVAADLLPMGEVSEPGILGGVGRQRFSLPDAIEEGTRVKTLVRLAGKLRNGGLDEAEIQVALQGVNETRCDPPLEDSEISNIAKSAGGWDGGDAAGGGDDAAGGGGVRFELGSEVELAKVALEEIETGPSTERAVFARGELWQYAGSRGVWESVGEEIVSRIVYGFDGEFFRYGNDRQGNPRYIPLRIKESMANAVYKIVSKQRSNILFFSAATPGITFGNGFIRVDSDGVHLEPFSPEQRSTSCLPFDYEAGAAPARFLSFLRFVFDGDSDSDDKIQLIREIIGVAMTHEAARYQRAVIFLGDGANGKSTLQGIIEALFGGDMRGMVTSVPPQEMDNEYRRAMLARSRLNLVSELPEADILHGEAVKAMISGDLMVGRTIRQSPFQFRPKCLHLFAANTLPGVVDMSEGFWRRWIVVSFNRTIKKEEQNPRIKAEIVLNELGEIACWALEGAAMVARNKGYTVPDSARKESELWRKTADQIASFVEDECEIGEGITKANKLYTNYTIWAARTGHRNMNVNNFSKRLQRLGIRRQKKKDGVYYTVGIKKLRVVK